LKNQTVYDRNGDGGSVSFEGDDGLGGGKECMNTGAGGLRTEDGGAGPRNTSILELV